jgi:hypothetical protein
MRRVVDLDVVDGNARVCRTITNSLTRTPTPDIVQKLSGVKSPTAFVEIWTEHARKQVETLTEQSKQLAALGQKVMRAIAEPFKGRRNPVQHSRLSCPKLSGGVRSRGSPRASALPPSPLGFAQTHDNQMLHLCSSYCVSIGCSRGETEVCVVLEYFFADFLPEIFLRVELWRVGRQEEQRDIYLALVRPPLGLRFSALSPLERSNGAHGVVQVRRPMGRRDDRQIP